MPLTLDPTKPPDTGESPTLGASRMRNISAFLLQLFGFTGTVSETLAVAPISNTDLTTGAMTLATKLTLGADGTAGKDAVAFDQFSNSGAGLSGWVLFPGGFHIEWVTVGVIATGTVITLTKSFTSTNFLGFGSTITGAAAFVGIAPTAVNQVTVSFSDGANHAAQFFVLGV